MFKSKEKFVKNFKGFEFSNSLWKLVCGMWKKLLKNQLSFMLVIISVTVALKVAFLLILSLTFLIL